MVLTAEYRSTRREPCSTVTLSTTNPIWTDRLSCVIASRLSELPVHRTATVNRPFSVTKPTGRCSMWQECCLLWGSVEQSEGKRGLSKRIARDSRNRATAAVRIDSPALLVCLWAACFDQANSQYATCLEQSLQQAGARQHIFHTLPLHGDLNGRFTFQTLLPFIVSTSYKIIQWGCACVRIGTVRELAEVMIRAESEFVAFQVRQDWGLLKPAFAHYPEPVLSTSHPHNLLP